MRIALVVAAGGALGAATRYGVQVVWPVPPWSTLVINLVGCFLIGVLLTRTARRDVRAFLGTGVLGGFTTFSTYAVEGFTLADRGRPLLAAGYVVGTVVAALAAARLGVLVGTPRRPE